MDGDVWCSEFDVALDGDRVLVRPVDLMSVSAFRIIPDPMRFNSAHVQFGASSKVDPDGLSPFRNT